MEDLVGKKFGFYGVDNNCFKLGRNVYEAIENESDGYRSYLDSIVKVDHDGIFFKRLLARVEVLYFEDDYSEVYELRDVADGHVWLTVGTVNMNDYYPYFVFNYQPKELAVAKTGK